MLTKKWLIKLFLHDIKQWNIKSFKVADLISINETKPIGRQNNITRPAHFTQALNLDIEKDSLSL